MSISEEIKASGLFDRDWYLDTYRDVALSGIPPLMHFVRIGMKIGRDPGPKFSSSHYATQVPPAELEGLSPVMHYLRIGREKGLSPCPEPAPDAAAAAAPAPAVPAGRPEGTGDRGGVAGPVFRSGRDAFMLRGLRPMAEVAVVVNAADTQAWTRALELLAHVGMAHDLFLLGAEEAEASPFGDTTLSVTQVGAADAPGNAVAFLRLAGSNVFDDYRALLWLSPDDAGGMEAGALAKMVELGGAFHADPDWGLAGDVRPLVPGTADDRLVTAFKTALPRLGLSYPEEGIALPSGAAIWIRPLVLRGLAPTLRPNELTVPGADKGFPGRDAVLGMLSVLAAEADLEIRPRPQEDAPAPEATVPARAREIKTLAFYLPQFHPIPENDLWWGKGFTEWTNVTRARQLFRGHYQPRVPTEMGYYDLRLEDTQVAQADLARAFGVHGFCYYYYWFDGKKLLNHPIEQMARSTKIDTGFCVCWANENWSRNWDGQNRHVLMEQTYSLESNIALIRELIPMMKDPRWIRHQGKPVMMVYRISIIPNWDETAAAWREECRKAGLGEIHLCAVRFGLETLQGKPEDHGLDSYVLFPPHEAARVDLRDKVLDLHKDFNGQIFDYTAVVDGDLENFDEGYDWPVHRGTMLAWDNTARRLTDARVFHGATPYGFRRWFKGVLEQEGRHNDGDESLVFVNAWNEWAEGTYLEPDQRWGRAYLEAIRSAAEATPGVSLSTLPEGVAAQPRGVTALERIGNPMGTPAQLEAPAWHEGQRQANPDWPTVMLCAHISGHHLFGGERSLLDVLQGLAEQPVNVVLTLPSGNNGAYIDALCACSLGVYAFPYPQWRDDRETYGWLSNVFADILARHAVDIVHVNTIVLLEPLAAATRLGRVRVIHSRELISLDDPLRERIGLDVSAILRHVFDRSDWVIGNSHATCQLFAREGRTLYVPNAVSVDEFAMNNKFGNTLKFGIVSSNIPKKGVADFVEVARRAADLAPRARFCIVGPMNDQVLAWKQEVARGERPDNLIFAGYANTPVAAMSQFNVLLNLSHFAESFGRTVAEAMAAGRPVIAYEWGALSELVRHEETGLLVPYRDIDAVVRAVVRICEDDSQIGRMAEAGKRFVRENFDQANLRRALADSYDRIAGPATARTIEPVAQSIGTPPPRTTVVVPVYNAPGEVRDCLHSLIRHTDLTRDRVLVIDDGSPDPDVAPMLAEFEGQPGLTILRNDPNMGYTRTINRGITEAGGDDVVLLNSDTIVTPKWLEGLRAAAYSRPRVATVTAMSDNAGAFSFPRFDAFCPKPDHMTHEEYALLLLQETGSCTPPEVPTGSGFCMYIRRETMDECGLFDEEGFPRGYGEENDFCMRAFKAGRVNLISPWSFVYHVRTASFKGEKTALVKAGVDVVTKRYPDYAKLVKEAFAAPEMAALREAAARAAA